MQWHGPFGDFVHAASGRLLRACSAVRHTSPMSNEPPSEAPQAANWTFAQPADFSGWQIEGAVPAEPGGWLSVRDGRASLVSPPVRVPLRETMGQAFTMEVPTATSGAGKAIAKVSVQFSGAAEFVTRGPSTIPLFLDGAPHVYLAPGRREDREDPSVVERVRIEFEGVPSRVRLERVFLRPRSGDFSDMDRRRVHVHSHRRSGTHFLIESLRKNIRDFEILKRGHEAPEIVVVPKGDFAVHIYRDGRDVLVSNYKWWMTSEESRNFGILPQFQGVSFADYVLGKVRIDVPDPTGLEGCGYLPRNYFADPIGYWIRFVEGFLARPDVINVSYSDLKRDPDPVIRKIAAGVGQEVRKVQRQETLTGFLPNKGMVGSFRDHFDARLHDAFWERAGAHMERWGFPR